MKTYLVSKSVLAQLLEVIQGCDYERTGVQQADETLRTILAKEPNEPVAWMHKDWDQISWYMTRDFTRPLYRKDTP